MDLAGLYRNNSRRDSLLLSVRELSVGWGEMVFVYGSLVYYRPGLRLAFNFNFREVVISRQEACKFRRRASEV